MDSLGKILRKSSRTPWEKKMQNKVKYCAKRHKGIVHEIQSPSNIPKMSIKYANEEIRNKETSSWYMQDKHSIKSNNSWFLN